MKKRWIWIAAVLMIGLTAGLTVIYSQSLPTMGPGFHQNVTVKKTPKKVQKPQGVHLMAVGDVMLARKVNRLTATEGLDYPFRAVLNPLRRADITFGNLESPLSNRGFAMPGKGICFRARPEMAGILADTGFDVMSVANNHALDYDADAFLDTMQLLEENKIKPVGGGRNLTEARQPVIIEKNGVKIGVLAYTIFADIIFSHQYPRRFEATDTVCGVAPLVEAMVLEDVKALDSRVDYTIVSLHWGVEYSSVPAAQQRELAHKIIDQGGDIVLGHHPHIIQGFERYKNGLIAYSLGNFVFDQNQHVFTRQGLMLDLWLTKKELRSICAYPVFIAQSQPYIMTGTEAAALLAHVNDLTRRLDTQSLVEKDLLVIPAAAAHKDAVPTPRHPVHDGP